MANEMTINEVLRTRPHPVSLRSTTLPQPKSDVSDLGHLRVPNSGKPEFGRGRDCSLLTKLSSSCTRDKV